MNAILRRALVLCAALISCAVAAGSPPVSDSPKRAVAGTPDSATAEPSVSKATDDPRKGSARPKGKPADPRLARAAWAVASLDLVAMNSRVAPEPKERRVQTAKA